MRAVLLLAANFVRQQRWLVLLLVVYAVAMAGILVCSDKQPPSTEDVTFFLRQQSLYAPLFSVFLAISAIHNERKSRRILAVMAKAITRSQYLAGFVVGIFAIAAVYCLAIGVAGTWLAHSAHISSPYFWSIFWSMLGIVLIASALVSAVALFFSTFLMPIFAAAATAASIAVPAVLAQTLGRAWGSLLPIYALLMQAWQSMPGRSGSADWPSLGIAAIETVIFWGLASWTFSGRDITTALE